MARLYKGVRAHDQLIRNTIQPWTLGYYNSRVLRGMAANCYAQAKKGNIQGAIQCAYTPIWPNNPIIPPIGRIYKNELSPIQYALLCLVRAARNSNVQGVTYWSKRVALLRKR